MKKEAIQKFGSLYQFGVDYMTGFNADADAFLSSYQTYKDELQQQGHSRGWEEWKENNQDLIIRLYDALNAANLIPKNI